MSLCMDGRACGLHEVLDTMLGVPSGKVRPYDLQTVGKEFIEFISWPGNGAEVECSAPA